MVNLAPTLFAGDSSDALARVYAVLPRAGLPEGAQLEGELVGPYCRSSQTLPARIRFIDRGPGPSLLAEAIVPDPCFWTPELPFLYKVELRAVAGEKPDGVITVAAGRLFGIRRLGVEKASIRLDARRFVPRGVYRECVGIADLKQARETTSALFVVDPSEDVLKEASEDGVLLAVRLRAPDSFTKGRVGLLQSELARLGRCPAVAVVVLDGDVAAGNELRLTARGTLLAQHVASADSLFDPAPWAHLFWWQIDAGTAPAETPPQDMPIIVYRPAPENATIEEGRSACDRLQAELAPVGDFAGYFC
jgi:hypothetical protein